MSRKNYAIAMRAVRRYLIENPGSTHEQIKAAGHTAPVLMNLHAMRLAYYTGGGKKGPAKWYAKANPHVNNLPAGEMFALESEGFWRRENEL